MAPSVLLEALAATEITILSQTATYVQNTASPRLDFGWKKNGWKNAGRKSL